MPATRLGTLPSKNESDGCDYLIRPLHEPTIIDPVADAANFDSVVAASVSHDGFLTNDVKTAHLAKYSDQQLEGRRRYYEREYTFERNERIRAENKRELLRTVAEISSRRALSRQAAEREFKPVTPRGGA